MCGCLGRRPKNSTYTWVLLADVVRHHPSRAEQLFFDTESTSHGDRVGSRWPLQNAPNRMEIDNELKENEVIYLVQLFPSVWPE